MADGPRLGNYLQLALPFTIVLLGLLSPALLVRWISLWIGAAGSAMVAILLIFGGLGLLIIPMPVVYLWTAFRMAQARREPTMNE